MIPVHPLYKNMEGAILVFLPGLSHIVQLNDLILADRQFSNKSKYACLPVALKLQSCPLGCPPKYRLGSNCCSSKDIHQNIVFNIYPSGGATLEIRLHYFLCSNIPVFTHNILYPNFHYDAPRS